MTKIFFTLCFMTMLCFKITSQNKISANGREYDINVVLMENTFRIHDKSGNKCGTVFIIGKPKKNNPKEFDKVLVTAAHVLDSLTDETAYLDLRIQKGDTFQILQFPIILRSKKNIFYKKHPKEDVAVMYISLPSMYTNNVVLMQSYLCSDNDFINWNILPGTKLKCLGFPQCIGIGSGLFPILRNGEIASYPLIPSSIYPTFCFDFEIYPGNSGGPVYFQERGRLNANGGGDNQTNVQFIAGLITSQLYSDLIDIKSRAILERTYIKLGIVVQSKYIKETLEMLP